ncbi:RecQ family zinc-binding domain-containing protein [Nonomuraea jabiensis]|uniref:ATP-dependent DNA helicase RecQ zinc-binding domain-containing protein n=1 Tax=Nonomuraea jabiensis TaxID=882448 RepID=A0A7W9GDK0_9ACTN|nr:RecQ family zinc-binding domain-containing protein [Nonomuraea jabiensis]MBB5781741.1 hypothetical protein [Nonomuraea jabiensis]
MAQEIAAAGAGTDRKTLSTRTGLSPRRLTLLLDLLERAGAVRLSARHIEPAPDAPAPGTAADLARHLAERRRDVERTRLEMMRHYAETDDCRRRFLLGYFGEQLPATPAATATPAWQAPPNAGRRRLDRSPRTPAWSIARRGRARSSNAARTA